MDNVFEYTPSGVCSRKISLVIKDGIIEDVSFVGGCNGNLQGISSLVKGMNIDEVEVRLENIKCGFKNTSCPAQLAQAIKQYKLRKGE